MGPVNNASAVEWIVAMEATADGMRGRDKLAGLIADLIEKIM
jgi:hypothetical protein